MSITNTVSICHVGRDVWWRKIPLPNLPVLVLDAFTVVHYNFSQNQMSEQSVCVGYFCVSVSLNKTCGVET